MEHVKAICDASEFLDPRIYDAQSHKNSILRAYLTHSHNRMDVVRSKFKNVGFNENLHDFTYYGHPAINAIFRKDGNHEDEIWIIAHHDYCAGLGAEDNASALAVMLEIGKNLNDNHGNVVFATFDLEEYDCAGSRRYAQSLPQNALSSIRSAIALDCLGSGKDISICRSSDELVCDPLLAKRLQKNAKQSGHTFRRRDYTFYSDHITFIRRRVPATCILSINQSHYRKYRKTDEQPSNDRKDSVAHTTRDLPRNLDTGNLKKVEECMMRFLRDG